MLSINEFLLEYKRKIPSILLLWTIILTFIICGLLIINKTVTINNYYHTEGIVKDKNICIYVLLKDLEKVIHNNEFYIKNKKYNYTIRQIDEEVIVNGTYFYKELLLEINPNENILIDNNVVDINFIVRKMTIFEYIINLIKGEL
jgi:hypothetical protein